jgi:prepilin-type N-terminal cleavage/methylation domain-containing protein
MGKLDERSARQGGFTLIEMMVVLLVLGVLSAIAVPSYLSARSYATNAAAQADLRNSLPDVQSVLWGDGASVPSSTAQFASAMQGQDPSYHWVAGPVSKGHEVSVALIGQSTLAMARFGSKAQTVYIAGFFLTSATQLTSVDCALPYGGNYLASVSSGRATVSLSPGCQSGPYYLEVYSAPGSQVGASFPAPPGCPTSTVVPNAYCSFPQPGDFPQTFSSVTKFSAAQGSVNLPSGCWQLDVVNDYSGAPTTVSNIVSGLGGNFVWGENGGSCSSSSSSSSGPGGGGGAPPPLAPGAEAAVLTAWSPSGGGTCWSVAQVDATGTALGLQPSTYYAKTPAGTSGCNASTVSSQAQWSRTWPKV